MTLPYSFRRLLTAITPVCLLLSTGAPAADTVTINITGKVVASPCTVDSNGTYNVNLGQNISAATLSASGSGSGWVPFDVTLSSCPSGTSSVTITFSGTPDSDDGTRYANTTGNGYAQRVAVELQDTSGSNAGNGKTLTKNVAGDKTVKFPLQARAYSAKGGVSPGNISAQVLMNLTYN